MSEDAYCPKCREQLHYCMGDKFKCYSCNEYFWTWQVLDKDGYYLMEHCPTHGHSPSHITYSASLNEKFCGECGNVMLKTRPPEQLRYRFGDPLDGIARDIQMVGDKACKFRFKCENYNIDCKNCPNAWESKYKAMSVSKTKKIVEASHKGESISVRNL